MREDQEKLDMERILVAHTGRSVEKTESVIGGFTMIEGRAVPLCGCDNPGEKVVETKGLRGYPRCRSCDNVIYAR